MRALPSLPYAFRTEEHTWIPVADGVRLSARLWLPDIDRPVPAVVEYIPYRKRDDTRWRDEPMHGYFAGHGFAAVRVDVRGTGASEGLLSDEYSEEELDDGVAVLRWVARQPWCTGRVGMIGKSWGGINALQIAARRPPELGAVITVCSTDDRYRTDAHYMGGLLLNENLTWGSVLTTLAARHPDPELFGDGWRRTWLERLEALPLFPARWMAHPLRDAYWRRASVADDYGAVVCPVLAVGGWADAYVASVPRLLAGLRGTRRGLIGPWAHRYPHNGVPGPAIGFLQEAVAWWDRWLHAAEGATPPEPVLRAWMAEPGRAPGSYGAEHGRWVAEDAWPSPRIETAVRELGVGIHPVPHGELVGLASGAWCAFGLDGDLPGDQRPDDERSLVFDFPPEVERREILGAPVVDLELESDRPAATVAVRLCDVAPDGTSRRVAYGLLDLACRNGPDRHEPLPPGRPVRVRVELGPAAWAFMPGHRVRVALSPGYWPVAWPRVDAGRLVVHAARSTLSLPVRPPRPEDAELRPFPPVEAAHSEADDDEDDVGFRRRVSRDPDTGTVTVEQSLGFGPGGEVSVTPIRAIGLDTGYGIVERFRAVPGHPTSAEAETHHVVLTRRGRWQTRVETRVRMTCDADHFHLDASVDASENGTVVAHRSWSERVPRNQV